MDLSDVTNVDGDRLYIDSIRRSKARSVIIISHIESALNMLKIDKEKSGMLEKYNVFYSCTIEKMSYDDAAQQYNSSIATVSRWIKELTKEMSIYIFGVDGINEL